MCDQHCTNLKGSYQCSCDPGYNLKHDNHTCKALNAPNILEPPSLLFASSKEVKLAYLDTDDSAKNIKIKGKRIIIFMFLLLSYHYNEDNFDT